MADGLRYVWSYGPMLNEAAAATADILCLINGAAHSGGADSKRQLVADALVAAGATVQVEQPGNCDELVRRAREAAQNRAKLVIAGGGDGTISAAANALAGTDTALAVLPLGTLNHFAKDLGIPLEIEKAVVNAFEGEIRTVDVAEVNGRIFINNSSIGLYPRMVRKREALQRSGWSKWLALARAAVAVFPAARGFWIRLNAGSRTLSGKTDFLFVGNNPYELTIPQVGARTVLDSGTLWAWQLPHTGRFAVMLLALRALFRLEKPKAPIVLTGREFRVEMRKATVDVAVDGEVVSMTPPLQYRSRPRALRVMVPKTAS
ncbi:MAG: NAD(+)/NADH kinase [Alphaproteobacteria bacterium]|nr:NAD(+)/NADH kinase [Alphaproteobacteria bacterium]